MYERRPPVHTVLVGPCRLSVNGQHLRRRTIALPAHTVHELTAYGGPYACVAYLDPRRYRFEDAQHLAHAWRGFVPGVDDLRDAVGDALLLPERRIDARVWRALDAIEDGASVEEAAAGVRLSSSRLTHLTSETVGAPPRVWGAWFKLQRAIVFAAAGETLTTAAHHAGFADSAHLTRTCKRMTGVRPGGMMPQAVHVVSR